MMTFSLESLYTWLTFNSQWLGLMIAFMAMLEALAIVGFFIPGIAIMFALGALCGSGVMSLEAMVTWAIIGAVTGDGISYQLGRHFHHQIRGWWPFSRYPLWMDKGERFFRDYGDLSIALGRFIGPIRPVVPVVAGMLDMPPLRFYTVNVLSAIPWAIAYMMPGYLAGQSIVMERGNSIPVFVLLGCLFFFTIGTCLIVNWLDKLLRKNWVIPFVVGMSALCALGFTGWLEWLGYSGHWHRTVISWIAQARFPYLSAVLEGIHGIGGLLCFFTLASVVLLCSLWRRGWKPTLIWGGVGIFMLGTHGLLMHSTQQSTWGYYLAVLAGQQAFLLSCSAFLLWYLALSLSAGWPMIKRILLFSTMVAVASIIGLVNLWEQNGLLSGMMAGMLLAVFWLAVGVLTERLLLSEKRSRMMKSAAE
ncbi:Inner membrane protein YabI [invertebrate metagenome]|uniref:Inner membrane protein YabI n=1 Tax=invertebrate metagenome TaxID=1711999 RepID=A0A2H9TA22_9ZZZZ